ncbi:nitroreductase family deazaflavin-dependent oxidoreductase [Microbacterium rhizophilus]|uniref:nitroreductase family deazaflavin-dependent oxidoreductase n=1 Tax=Microbacterium rhizophilus TaxID=3138934 RepID=UPI0031EE2C9E
MGGFKRWFLRVLNRTLNPLTLRAARSGRGPFSLVEHVGRRTGRVFEAPLILARVDGGFVAELTYGDQVNWYRNVVTGGGRVLWRGEWYRITGVSPCGVDEGMRAFGVPAAWVLRVLRRREFRLLRVEADQPT